MILLELVLMIRQPRFRSHLRVEVVPPNLVFFLHESGCQVLQGRLICSLAPLINGHNTVSDIVKQSKGQMTMLDVECGLLLLDAEGYITDASDVPPSGLDVFCDSLNLDPKLFTRRLSGTRVRVASFGKVSPAPFTSILRTLGIQVATEGDFTVMLVDDYLRQELEDFNREAIRHRRTWMLVKPIGSILWLGPVFSPPNTPCWSCLAQRLRQNRRAEAFIKAHRGMDERTSPLSSSGLSSTIDAALNLAATETLKWIVRGCDGHTNSILLTLDVKEMKLEKHAVMRLKNCASCARSVRKSKDPPTSIILKSGQKIFTSDGGHRSTFSETTFQKYKHHISPLTGIVEQVKPYHSDASGLVHVYLASHAFLPPLKKQDLLRRGLHRASAGKGMTPQQAKTSALCEALERYSGVFRGDEFRIKAAYLDLGDEAIHPNALMNFSQNQYENRDEWNTGHSDRDWVPKPFDEKREIEWTPVWSLTDMVFKYVPTVYCYYGYVHPPEHEFCRADSNGNAAGNTLEEAILQGFTEIVERDCTALWWYNRAPRPAVDLDSFAVPYFQALRDYYSTLDRDVWALDITNDFDIPAFAALSVGRGSAKQDFTLGLGAHFDPVIALSRALTEMNQFLPRLLSGKPEGGRVLIPEGLDLAFLNPAPLLTPKNLEDFPLRAAADFRDDVMTCVKLAQARGMETLVLDQTRPDVELPVVKVIVPGLRQMWARFGQGRLYDLPVKLGWLKTRLTEEQLNPGRLLI
jgi:oxazoline/thiazoline synthase